MCGPMRGYPLYNFPAFDAAAAKLRARGWKVINPADLDRKAGFLPNKKLPKGFLRKAMQRDLTAICDKCSAIMLLHGWEKSEGAKVELALANLLQLLVLQEV